MDHATVPILAHQSQEPTDWRLWTAAELNRLPFDVRDCVLFGARRLKKEVTHWHHAHSCRSDVCPACGHSAAKKFIDQHRIRWLIPAESIQNVHIMVIDFPSIPIGGQTIPGTSPFRIFQAQAKKMRKLEKDLDRRWESKPGIVGWFGVAHLAMLKGWHVRQHLHVGIVGTSQAVQSLMDWIDKWVNENGAQLKIGGVRELEEHVGYLRHAPVRIGAKESDFCAQGLASVYSALEKPFRIKRSKLRKKLGRNRKLKVPVSMFVRFVSGPVWSQMGMKRLGSRVICERIALLKTGGIRAKLIDYPEDGRNSKSFIKTLPKIGIFTKCPHMSGENQTTRCDGLSLPIVPGANPLMCKCDRCGHEWKALRVAGKKRNRKDDPEP